MIGLVCSLPSQYRRDWGREVCRYFVQFYADQAEALSMMAEDPAAWIDPFRPELRQQALWALEDSRRFSGKSFYDSKEHQRVSEANTIARKDKQFWARFDAAAALHGYRKPRVNRGARVVWGIDGFLVRTCPTFFLIILLAGALRVARCSRLRQTA
jgi:hypothetical protein